MNLLPSPRSAARRGSSFENNRVAERFYQLRSAASRLTKWPASPGSSPTRSARARGETKCLPSLSIVRRTGADYVRRSSASRETSRHDSASVTTRGGVGVLWQANDRRCGRLGAAVHKSRHGLWRRSPGRSKILRRVRARVHRRRGQLSQAHSRRVFRQSVRQGRQSAISVFRSSTHDPTNAYEFGGQGVEVEVAMKHSLSSRTSLWMAGTGGSTFLGAVDALLRPADEVPERVYDYGPTFRFGGVLELQHAEVTIVRLMYQGYQLNVVDGTRAFHVLQRGQLDIRIPIVRQFALGMTGEFFFRKAHLAGGNRTAETSQLRLFAAWNPKAIVPRPPAPRFRLRCRAPATAELQSGTVPTGGLAAPQSPVPSSVRSSFGSSAGRIHDGERAAMLAAATAFSPTAGASSSTSADESASRGLGRRASCSSALASKP